MPDQNPLKPADIATMFNQSLAWVSKNYKKLGGVKIGGRMFFPRGSNYMSAYFVEKKGWRYDFMMKGRHTQAWFKTKREAKEAEEKKRQS